MSFCPCIVTFDWYFFQLIACLKPDFNCYNSFTLSMVNKVHWLTKSTWNYWTYVVANISLRTSTIAKVVTLTTPEMT